MSNEQVIKELDRIIRVSKSVIDSAVRLRGQLEELSPPAPTGAVVHRRTVLNHIQRKNNKIVKA